MRSLSKGFTLIELMVVISLAAILLALGVPMMTTYFEATKVRFAAESFYGAVQQARAEAIRTNVPVALFLTDSDVTASSIAISSSGKNWVIRASTAAGASFTVPVGSKSAAEASADRGVTVTDVTAPQGGGVVLGEIKFDGFGRLIGVQTQGAPSSRRVRFGHSRYTEGCTKNDEVRCIDVVISAGGQAKLCEHGRTTPGDQRAC